MTTPPFETLVLRPHLDEWAELVFLFGFILAELKSNSLSAKLILLAGFSRKVVIFQEAIAIVAYGYRLASIGLAVFLENFGFFVEVSSIEAVGVRARDRMFLDPSGVESSVETLVGIRWLWALEVELRLWGRFRFEGIVRFGKADYGGVRYFVTNDGFYRFERSQCNFFR